MSKDDALTYEVLTELVRCIRTSAETIRLDYEVPVALIGASAMAVHNYVRATQDVDLGIWVIEERSLFTEVERTLQHPAVESITRTAVGVDDPLGGLWKISGAKISPIDVVNFYAPNQHRSPGGGPLRHTIHVDGIDVVDVPHLIVLKLYASSRSDAFDVIELIKSNPELDLQEVREVAARYKQLRALDALLGVMS